MKNVIHAFGVSGSGTTMARLCHSAFVRVATAEKQCSALRICCEKVDSFSSVGESGLALTIFPFSFAAKATYVAINDSFGRAIDRFLVRTAPELVLTMTSPNTHACDRFGKGFQAMNLGIMHGDKIRIVYPQCFFIKRTRLRYRVLEQESRIQIALNPLCFAAVGAI